MKNKQIVDPDMEVIGMVNDGVSGRQRVKETRQILNRMHEEQAQARKAARWRAIRSMLIDVGVITLCGGGVLASMAQGLVDPQVGVPIFVLCLIWAAVRIDRFVRR